MLGNGWSLGSLVCGVFLYFVTFPYGVSGQLWYLIALISVGCPLQYFYIGKTNQIFLSETTMPNTLIFGIQHHLVRLYQFYSIWSTGTINWTRLRACTFTIRIYWENLLVLHHKAHNIDICYVASPCIPLLSLFILWPLCQNWPFPGVTSFT